MDNHPDKTTDSKAVALPEAKVGGSTTWQVIRWNARRTLPGIALVLCDNAAGVTPFDSLLFSATCAFVGAFFRLSFYATNPALIVRPLFDVDGRIKDVRQSTDDSSSRFQDEFVFRPF